MAYEAKNFEHLLGTPGFSDQLLKNHFTLYQGYVKNTNKVRELLAELSKAGKTGTPEFNELSRRFGWEFNGMHLHELYFGNMKNGGVAFDESSDVGKKIVEQWGSFDAWVADFKATGGLRGIGWVVLYHDKEADCLFNVWINEHDGGHPAGENPLLIMDVWEHAFMVDYGLKKADYIESFMKAIDWSVVNERFAKCKK